MNKLQNFQDGLNSPNSSHVSSRSSNSIAFCTFDMESLYTNVENDLARKSAIALLSQYKQEICTFGLSIADIDLLIKVILRANIFKFSEQFYRQKTGLAMGNRSVPILAICFMDRLKRMELLQFPSINVSARYIGDIFISLQTPKLQIML